MIPHVLNRRGGKRLYAEWAHVIGIFQTLMFLICPQGSVKTIVDFGCGTGILAIAADFIICLLIMPNMPPIDVLSALKDVRFLGSSGIPPDISAG